MNELNCPPVMSSRLDEVDTSLRLRGWAVLTNAGVLHRGVPDAVAVRQLAGRFGRPSSRDGGLDLWEIRPRSANPNDTFSQRAGDAGLHTDAAYRADPEPRFILLCVRPAADGGLTRILVATDATRGLDPAVASRLRVPQWRWRVPEVFGGGVSERYPVLSEDGTIRWRLDNLAIPADLRSTAEAFARHMENHPMLLQFPLQPDSLLVCDNRLVLHGRSTFADPRRWLIRLRLVTP